MAGVGVWNTPTLTDAAGADLAMGILVAVMRRLCEADRFVRAGRWPVEEFPSGVEVRGKTCGIVGLGRIGREIAQRAAGFGMSICYHGPRIKDGVACPYFAELDEIARHPD